MIHNHKLYVEVAWVGPNIVKVAKELESRYMVKDGKSIVYLSQMPSPLTLRNEHVSVNFPPCDEYSEIQPSFNCHYSNIRLVKLAWEKLLKAARPAFEVSNLILSSDCIDVIFIIHDLMCGLILTRLLPTVT